MSDATRRAQLARALQDDDMRAALVEADLAIGLAFQVRAIRHAHGWSTRELAARAGTSRSVIERLESANSEGRFAVRTLLRVAAALDVALIARLASFGDFLDILATPTPVVASPYDQDARAAPPADPAPGP